MQRCSHSDPGEPLCELPTTHAGFWSPWAECISGRTERLRKLRNELNLIGKKAQYHESIAILAGDPTKPGPFVERFKIPLNRLSTESDLRIIRFRHPSSENSRLQLALEFVQETPIRVLGDELLRAGLDQPCFVHAQRVK